MTAKNLLTTLFMALVVAGMTLAQATQPILRLNSTMHTSRINRLSSDALGKYILTCSYDKTSKLWDAATGGFIRTFRHPIDTGDVGTLFACALSPDGKIAAVSGYTTGTDSLDIYLFNTSTGELVQRITGLENVILDLEFSLDGRYLAAGLFGKNGVRIYAWSVALAEYQLLTKLEGYGESCYNLCFDKTGRLATVCDDGFLRLYDNGFTKINETKVSGGNNPFSLAFSPDDSKIAVACSDTASVVVYDGVHLSMLFKPDVSDTSEINLPWTVAYTDDGRYLLGGGTNQVMKDSVHYCLIRRWDLSGNGRYTDFAACQNVVLDIKPMPDSSFIFCGASSDFGKMKEDGDFVFYNIPEIHDFSSLDRSYLKVNTEGDQISFQPSYKPVLYFSLKNRQLTEEPSGFQNLESFTDRRDSIIITEWEYSLTPKLNGRELNFLHPYEPSQNVDISTDATSIVFAADWDIYCLNALGEKKWAVPTQVAAWAVNIAGDDRTVVAAMFDGSIRWYRMSDGALLLTLFAHPDNKRWILYTANGYYVCSEGGDELFGWHINNGPDHAAGFYPAKNYADQFFRPDIVRDVMEKCQTDLEILIQKGEQKTDISKLPPLVKITSPQGNSVFDKSQLTVSVEVTDQGGGLDEVLLYLNGKLAETMQRGVNALVQEDSSNVKVFNITLTTGENRIKATAFNDSRTEAISDEITVTCKGMKATADLYLLLIGINDYKNPKYRLNYAVADAIGVETEMKKGIRDIFGKVETILMKDGTVTRTSILENFEALKMKVKQEDVFMFYYAGHGVMSEDVTPQFYIVPFDVTQLVNTNAEMQKEAISAVELQKFSKDLKAQKQLFVFDACQSGGLVEMLASRGALEERAIAQLARSTGTYWIAASGSEQFATEFATLGHGLFTYVILQGLQGEADGNSDQKITVEELSSYVKDKLPEFSEKYKGEAQYPNSFGYGMDFPIYILK
jgi:WD40 repeat protein